MRIVVGCWETSPFGTFADVMVAEPDGTRVLLAPGFDIAEFVSTTYRFDRVETGPVTVTPEREGERPRWHVVAPRLAVTLEVAGRAPVGWLLRAVPSSLAAAPVWTWVTDPVARAVLRGVRTRGTAGNDRREYYGATDLHRITALRGTWRGRDLGDLSQVAPDPGFGFGSTPRTPSLTSVVTTIDVG